MLVCVMRRPRIIEDARGVTENPIATLQSARRWLPPARKSGLKQRSIRRLPAPDGDRRHRPESCSVVNEISTFERDEYVVRVLVLRQNRLDVDRRALRPAPVQHKLKRGLGRHDPRQSRMRGLIEVRVINQRDFIHELPEKKGATG